ncbi:hypothetical protein Tbd_1066 [Thiobacillus denitrificans ATCC 25259]|uniref:Uncharacterized protein n=1 Tax=Thiobacillus denitrificans (strain ATCC 25259 / T1) TaxID=292415 RepID=Q3SJY0_THIDA|nr:hypothetical protein Tbd_1066 [Thiobacillus denitrificans ATCC 25259]
MAHVAKHARHYMRPFLCGVLSRAGLEMALGAIRTDELGAGRLRFSCTDCWRRGEADVVHAVVSASAGRGHGWNGRRQDGEGQRDTHGVTP